MADTRAIETGPGEMMGNAGPGMLAGLRVIEIADERAEYTGLLLAGLGAEVVKIEPPEGNATRRIGPFLDDEPGLGALAVLLELQPQQEIGRARSARGAGARAHAAAARRRRRAARCELRRAERGAGPRPRGAQRALPAAGHRAHDAVRR